MRINFNPNVRVPNFGKIVISNDENTKKLMQNKRFEKVVEMLSDMTGDEVYRCSLINRRHGYSCIAVVKSLNSKNKKDSILIYANDTPQTLEQRAKDRNFLDFSA